MRKLAWDSQRTRDRADGKYIRDQSCTLYNTTRWHRLSRIFRAQSENLFCAECKKNGVLTPTEVVDHIVPWPICKDYFYDVSNLQPLCQKCNYTKGQRDKKIIQQWRIRQDLSQ